MVDTTEFNLVPNNEEEEFTVDFGEVTRLAGSSDFNQLQNRPKYDGQVMTGETDIPKVPTATSELNNDSDYQTGSEVQQTINAAIADKQDKLTAGQNITISEQNVISATGLTEVDWGDIGGNLNDQIDLKDVLDTKQDTLTPGDNVTIANNIISATDTKYTAGNGLSLNGTQFSADTAVLQEKLDAGNAITIENNTINADIYPADFFTNEATDTDTGSNITLDKTIPATLKSVELYGDTEQQTYSGKNLLNPDVYASGTDLYTPTVGTTITNTLSPNVTSSFADQTLSVTTTTASGGALYLSPQLAPGTYHISTTIKSGTNNSARIRANILDSNHVVLRNDDYYTIQTDSSRDIGFNITLASGETYVAITLVVPTTGGGALTATNPQLELGSTATSYEKFVGGVPAPNPDYPQNIHVVTGEQTVTVRSKNLIDNTDLAYDYTNANPNEITLASTTTGISMTYTGGGDAPFVLFVLQNLSGYEGKTIRMSSTFNGDLIRIYTSNADGTSRNSETQTSTSGEVISWTVPNDLGDKPYLAYGLRGGPAGTYTFDDLIMTIDDDDMTYQPHQSQSYTVDLGSTELCKIGDYQDYIYKSGDDWYVHKATGKAELGTLNWNASATNQTGLYRMVTRGLEYSFVSPVANNTPITGLSSHFMAVPADSSGTYGAHTGVSAPASGRDVYIYSEDYNTSTSAADFKTWLANNDVTFYYALATPTDTKITDAGLIADLNALAGAKSYLDVTNFSVAATGTNLPALLKPEVYVKSLNGVLEYLSHI